MEYTYDGILDNIQERLGLETEWANTFDFGVYSNLLNPMAYIIYQAVYAAEFYYRESSWKNAQKIESLMVKARYLDYDAYRKVGASGNLVVSGSSTFSSTYSYTGSNVNIARWTEFKNATGTLNVYATAAVVYTTGTVGDLTVAVKQGTPKSFTYFALGNTEEKIYIYSDSVDNTEITVQIVDANGAVLNDVSVMGVDVSDKRMYFLTDPNNYYCEISNATDFSYVEIMFGNGINTKKLTAGERVLVKYAETLGTSGNITSTGTITAFKTTPQDVYGNDATLYVNNTAAISDASNIEDIEHIRNHAPNIFQTGYRCGGLNDWVAILEDHAYITNAVVWSAYDVGDFSDANVNKVYISAVSADGDNLTTAQKEDLTVNYLKQKKSPTEVAVFTDLATIFAKFVIVAEISIGQTTTVDQAMKTALTANYGILNTDFNTNIYESDFYTTLSAVSNVTWHNTEVYTLEKDFGYSTPSTAIAVSVTAADNSGVLGQIHLKEDSLEIWVENLVSGEVTTIERAGYDVSGVILEDNGYTLSSTGITYASNTFQFTIDTLASGDTDNYNIHVSYKTKDGNGDQTNNLRLSDFSQITDIDTNYVSTTLTYA